MADIPFFTLPLYNGSNIILSMFLISSVCAGVPAVLWALIVLHRHHKNKLRISVFIVLLLTNDLLELLLNLYIIAKLWQGDRCEDMTCRILSSFWSAFRVCGVFLQQMMVLEADLALIHSFCPANVLFLLFSLAVYVNVLICFYLSMFSAAPPLRLFSLLPLLALTIPLCTLACGKSPINIHRADRTMKHEYVVLPCAIFTLILYLLFLVAYLSQSSWSLWLVCLLSLRVIIDPLLCVMGCQEKITRAHTDPKTDQTSVQAEQSV